MGLLTLNCCENSSWTVRIRQLFCFCCRPKQDSSSQPNMIIIFSPLRSDDIDYESLFDHVKHDGINIVFNKKYDIISAHSENISELFGKKPVESMISKNLERDMPQIIPVTVVTMIKDIIDNVKDRKQKVGCLVDISKNNEPPIKYILAGFPVMDGNNPDLLYSVMIVKRSLNSAVSNTSILRQYSAS